jgi:peroxiredoxin
MIAGAPRARPARAKEARMVAVGDRVPDVTVKVARATVNEDARTGDLFAGKRVVLFGLPGAFTPTCSAKHLPGFVERAAAFRDKGVDLVACISVNDVHVMKAWGASLGALDKVLMLADGNGDFTRAMDLVMDGRAFGMGERSRRYAALIEDNVLRRLDVEQPGKLEVSSAEAILARL